MSNNPSSPRLRTAQPKLVAQIAAAQKKADSAKTTAKAAKAAYREAKKNSKVARRAAKVAKKTLKELKRDLAATHVRTPKARKSKPSQKTVTKQTEPTPIKTATATPASNG